MHKYEISEVENRNQDHDTSTGSIQHLNRKVVETSFSWNPEDNEHNDEPNKYNKVINLDKNPNNGCKNQEHEVQNPKKGKSQPSSPYKSDKASQNQPESDTKMTSADPHVYSTPQRKLPPFPGQTASLRADETTVFDRKPSLPVARPPPGVYATTADNNYGKVDYGKTGGGGGQYAGSKGTVGTGDDHTDSGCGYGNTNSGYIKQDNDDNNNSDKGSDGGKEGGQNGFTPGDSDKKGGGMGGMKGYFRVPKPLMLALVVCVIISIVLVLLTAIVLGVVISSMNSDIDELKEENKLLRTSIQKLDTDFSDSNTSVLLAEVRFLNTRVGDVENENLQLSTKVQNLESLDIQTKLSSIEYDINAIEPELANFVTINDYNLKNDELQRSIDNITDQFTNKLAQLNISLISAEESVQSLSAHVSLGDENLTNRHLKLTIESLNSAQNVSVTDETIQNLTTHVSLGNDALSNMRLKMDIENVNTTENVSVVEDVVQNLTVHVSLEDEFLANKKLKEDIETLKNRTYDCDCPFNVSQIEEMEDRISHLEEKVETLNQTLNSTKVEVALNKNLIEPIGVTVGNMSSNLTTLEADVEVNTGNIHSLGLKLNRMDASIDVINDHLGL